MEKEIVAEVVKTLRGRRGDLAEVRQNDELQSFWLTYLLTLELRFKILASKDIFIQRRAKW